MNPPIKLLALAAIFAGGLRILAALIPYVPNSAGLELLYGIIDLGMLFGILGLAAVWGANWNHFSVTSFAVAIIGLSVIVGPDPSIFGIDFYVAGSAIYLLGLSGVSVCLLLQKRGKVPALLWLTCLVMSLTTLAFATPLITSAAGITLGAGFMALGALLWPRHSHART